MKKFISILLSGAIALGTAGAAPAAAIDTAPAIVNTVGDSSGPLSGTMNYTLSGGVLTITGTGPMPNFENYNYLPWKNELGSIRSVVIGEGVTTIGVGAFYNCSSLSSVSVPSTVTDVYAKAFNACTSLSSITLPNVSNIATYAFVACAGLRSVTIGNPSCNIRANSIPPGATIYGQPGSTAESYARSNGNQFSAGAPSGGDPVVTPTQPPTEPVTEPVGAYHTGNVEDLIVGDVNHDGVVDVFDLALVKRELVQTTLTRQDRRRADTDADGKVGVVDAVAVQKYLLNQGGFKAVEEKRSFQYALDMSWQDGVQENTNEGFRDKAYVNLDNKTGSFLDWDVTVPTDGNYLCTFGIANGSRNNRQMKIEVNDNADYWVQDFLSTDAWTTWQERGIVLPLKAGKNTIRLTSATAEGGPNFDYLRTEWTDEPVPEVWTEPVQQETQPVQNVAGRTVWIAGDSTVQTYNASKAPQQGWGAYLSANLPEGVKVENRAIAGRSSKSFYDNGRLTSILDSIQKDDYLLVQFGINDAGSSKPERYAPTCGQVPGTENSFEWYMQKYIEGAKAKGAKPVMVTTVIGLKAYSNGKFVGSYGNYCDSMKKLAAYYQIPCIDLNTLMVNHYNSIGYDAAYKYHMCSTGSSDMTHFTETGAKAVAKLVADEMTKQGLV